MRNANAFLSLNVAFALALQLLVSGPLFASGGDESDRLARGIAAHDAVRAGDFSRLGESLELLGPEGWDRPSLAEAYHGSAMTLEALKAKQDGKLLEALGFIDTGTKEIDEAVRKAPEDQDARLLRMENSLDLCETSPVDRSKEASSDISFLRSRWASLSPECRAIVELDSGRLSLAGRRLGEALGSWRSAVRDAPASEAATRARTLIARYGE
jgi:hypothetical protein